MNEILEIFKNTGALKKGHFKLTSGLHSSTYFQCALVLQYPEYCQMLAEKIVNHFSKVPINVVVAPAIGGIVIGQEVGRQMGIRTIFSERENGTMCLRRGFTINKDERVLVCEDVVTTGGSVFELIDIVKQQGALVAGVGFIVDRSGGMVNFVTDQFSVFKLHAESYNPEDCPLCADKIPLKKPGSRNIY